VNRHLLSAADLSRDDALRILDTAEELARVADRPIKKLPTLRGRTVVNLFFEDSTRTRISFEAAAKRLSADVINFSAKGSSVAKGESLKDTALTLEAMGADAVVVRHSAAGAPHRLAGWVRGSVINAGDGAHEHPTQALLDAFTIRRRLFPGAPPGSGLEGVRATIVGDVLHSRVARSNVWLLHTLGAEVTLVAPPTLLPVAVDTWPCAVSYDLAAVLPKSDLVMMLRVQHERMNAAYFPSVREYSRRYGLDRARLAQLPGSAIVMHPGPMNRGVEIAAEVADSPRSTVVEQVTNGVSVRMAVLYLLLGGADPGGADPGGADPGGADSGRAGPAGSAEPGPGGQRAADPGGGAPGRGGVAGAAVAP
jgi:aspartate carbamoyltransferase catalytic subunit